MIDTDQVMARMAELANGPEEFSRGLETLIPVIEEVQRLRRELEAKMATAGLSDHQKRQLRRQVFGDAPKQLDRLKRAL